MKIDIRNILAGVVAFALIVLSFSAQSQNLQNPDQIEGAKVIESKVLCMPHDSFVKIISDNTLYVIGQSFDKRNKIVFVIMANNKKELLIANVQLADSGPVFACVLSVIENINTPLDLSQLPNHKLNKE